MEIENLYEIFLNHPIISKDTRELPKGCIYWGIKGDRFDGSEFAPNALDNGAAVAVIDNPQFSIPDKTILVEDSVRALQQLANYHRRQLKTPIIAIGGSNGKTTTKELTWRVLSSQLNTFATPGNYNNHIGLPLSLLMLNKSHQAAVIELGANHPGENMDLCKICEPDYAIVTNIGKDHLEGFGSLDGVEKANCEIYDFLKESGGTAFVNTDDERLVRNTEGLKTFTYGMGKGELEGKITGNFPFITATIQYPGWEKELDILSNLFGSFHIYNVLAAAAVGIEFGISPDNIKSSIENYVSSNNRSQFLTKRSNKIILDAYNANPSSLLPAIKDFEKYPSAKKVLCIGDMFEMGEFSEEEHQKILDAIDYGQFEYVLTAGEEFLKQASGYQVESFKTTAELCNWVSEKHFESAVFYIKGSRGMKMEKVVEAI